MALEVRGLGALNRRLEDIARRTPQAVGSALYQEALGIQAGSMDRTPVKTGALKGSHRTVLPDFSGGNIAVRITVGGPAVRYAARQHNETSYHHDNGEALFLEKAIKEAEPGFGQRVFQRARVLQ